MKFFIDTADTDAIRALTETGLVDGVTTNPSLIAKSGRDFKEVVREIAEMVPGPVSAEVAATDYDTMMKEAAVLGDIAGNIAIKVPLTPDGLRACRAISEEGRMVNVTLCFSAVQALLAAKCGAAFISPFIGRLDDAGHNGMELIGEIASIYSNYDFETEILAASIRTSNHVKEAALAGADVATVPPKIIDALFQHPLTDKGLDAFVEDWKGTGQSII